ncbi:MAG: HEAT repeat domain-containing protein [Planctomycetes bacterium]|nr:HEAT repeat domain-containing protein [Planctomycetota bacterium]
MKLYFFIAAVALTTALCGCTAQNDDLVQMKKDIFLLQQYSQANLDRLDSIKKEDLARIYETLNTLLVRVQELSMAVSRIQTRNESSDISASPVRGVNEIIDLLIVKLKTQPDVEKVIPEFRQAGELAVPRLVDILRAEDPAIRNKALRVLEKLDARNVGPAVLPLLEQNLPVRAQIVQLLGTIGYKDASQKLLPMLGTAEGDLRFSVADTLVKLKCKEAVPALIGYLRDDSDQRRAFAFETLKSNVGKEFDYKYYFNKEVREESVKKWDDWWKTDGPKFVFPGE